MKISFLISAIVLYLAKTVFTNNSPVGTVLFTTTDLVKKCWTDNDKALLRARLIMQDVIPEPESLDFSKPNAVSVLLDYFHACYEIISTSTYGNIQNLMFIALSDAIGGYLRAYVLPLTAQAYYAGKVKYADAKQLFALYDDIRVFLKTSGSGWAGPQKMCNVKYKLQPLVITDMTPDSACKQLYTIEKMGQLHCITPKTANENFVKSNAKLERMYRGKQRELLRNNYKNEMKFFDSSKDSPKRNLGRNRQNFRKLSKRRVKPNLDYKEDKNEEGQQHGYTYEAKNVDCSSSEQKKSNHHLNQDEEENLKKLIIPLPVLDDSCRPHSIAVPFKNRPLRNLKSRSSAYVLENYYTTVVKCLTSNHNSKRDIRNFNGLFNNWLTNEVCPRLRDEEWYPAFGGVLRVMETIKKMGLNPGLKSPASDDIAFMFSKGLGVEEYSDLTPKGKSITREVKCDEQYYYPRRYFMFSVIIVTAIFLVIFCMGAFYYQATIAKRKAKECSNGDSNGNGGSGGGSGGDPKKDSKSGDEKFLNVEFLVKFFKKNANCADLCDRKDQNDQNDQKDASKYDFEPGGSFGKPDDYRSRKKYDVEKASKEHSKKKPESKQKGELVLTGQGDVPAFIISGAGEPDKHFKTPNIPVYTLKTKSKQFKNEKIIQNPPLVVDSRGDTKVSKRHTNFKDHNEKVQTIWKKPSAWFHKNTLPKKALKNKKESSDTGSIKFRRDPKNTVSESGTLSADEGEKDYSTEKRSSCCSGSCTHTNETTTNSTLQTQAEETMSSRVEGGESRMEFFDRVVARHKTSRKSPIQESSGETDSEGEDSYSSESD